MRRRALFSPTLRVRESSERRPPYATAKTNSPSSCTGQRLGGSRSEADLVDAMGTKDPRAEAEKYLERHNVRGLFKHLSTKVLFAKPEDPKAFLVAELKKILECQQEQAPVPSMFEEKDLVAMFGMFDVTGCGKISSAQMEKAMQNLGIEDFVATSTEKVDLNMFIGTARHELDKVALRMPSPSMQ